MTITDSCHHYIARCSAINPATTCRYFTVQGRGKHGYRLTTAGNAYKRPGAGDDDATWPYRNVVSGHRSQLPTTYHLPDRLRAEDRGPLQRYRLSFRCH